MSGFLIGRIIIKTFIQNGSYTLKTFAGFIKRRWYKTLPVYYLAIFINYIIGHFITGTSFDFNWKYLLFIHTFFESSHTFFPISYSLAMEEWFYLLFPLFFLASIWLFKKREPYLILVGLCIAYIILSVTMRMQIYLTDHPHWDTVMRKSLLTRIDCSIYGVLMALFFYKSKEWFIKYRNWLLILGLLLYAISIYFRILYPEGFYYNVLYFTFIPFAFAVSIPFFYCIKRGSYFVFTLFTFLSLTAFAFYLFHLSPIMEVFLMFTKDRTLPFTLLAYAIYLIVTFSTTSLWYRYVEKPITELRDNF
ncbi:MAG: acyltransferase family protein [Bacteroidetes bacterium]|nr:acyltransferase family protein [Bacteroidota bacterium]